MVGLNTVRGLICDVISCCNIVTEKNMEITEFFYT